MLQFSVLPPLVPLVLASVLAANVHFHITAQCQQRSPWSHCTRRAAGLVHTVSTMPSTPLTAPTAAPAALSARCVECGGVLTLQPLGAR